MGIGRLYIHLDGRAQPGYDNARPDYLLTCQEAGGWEGMKSLVDVCHERGDIFGTYDQYHSCYLTAQTLDANDTIRLANGAVPERAHWVGGYQTYLYAELVPDYVHRNFAEIAAHGTRLDCVYSDVFTCNEGDEYSNPEHRMIRRECLGRCVECSKYLPSHGVLSPSEEVSD